MTLQCVFILGGIVCVQETQKFRKKLSKTFPKACPKVVLWALFYSILFCLADKYLDKYYLQLTTCSFYILYINSVTTTNVASKWRHTHARLPHASHPCSRKCPHFLCSLKLAGSVDNLPTWENLGGVIACSGELPAPKPRSQSMSSPNRGTSAGLQRVTASPCSAVGGK